jgi:CRP/FNR family transcriptional regulator, cyclic AMP receptor protein
MKLANLARRPVDIEPFLRVARKYGKRLKCSKGQILFTMGDIADSIYYIQNGTVKLSVVSAQGKEAVFALLGPGDFFGEGCIIGQSHRLMTAAALSSGSLIKSMKQEIMRLLHKDQILAWVLITYLITHQRKVQEDLIDQLFNSTEKRLARALLLLANYGTTGKAEGTIPRVSQTLLAEIIGASRPRVSLLMNKFRKLGFIEYNHSLTVHGTLLAVVLHD